MRFIFWCCLLLNNSVHSQNILKNSQQLPSGQLTMTQAEPLRIIDFTVTKEVDNWRVTNDSVMGGLSNGLMTGKQKHGVFSGNISLRNNGGFSSIFRQIEPLPQDLAGVLIDIEGDGLTYQARMVVNFKGYRLAYKYDVETTLGQRKKIFLKFTDFQASFRGRIISTAPTLKSENIREVGFLVTRKTEGTFALVIFSLVF